MRLLTAIADGPTCFSEQCCNPAITVSAKLSGQLDHIRNKSVFIGMPLRDMSLCRAMLPQARRLRDFVHMNGEDEVVLLIGFLMYTGARRHEAMNSEWQHINLGDKDWYVPITKSGKPRHIVLNGKAIEIIQRAEKLQLKKHGHIMQWLFVNPQTHKPYRCIFHKWNRIRNELGLQNMRIHDLRHSFASTLVNNGATLYEVQKLLGHSRSATTERYAHLANHRLQRAASLIDKAYS